MAINRKCLILFSFLMHSGYFYSQKVINVDFVVKNNYLVVTYDLVDCLEDVLSDVELSVACDGKKIYPVSVSGDLKRIACGNQKKISWNVLEDKSELKGKVEVVVTILKTYFLRITEGASIEIADARKSSSDSLLTAMADKPLNEKWDIVQKCVELDLCNYKIYRERALLKLYYLADTTGALSDVSNAIKLNSEDYEAYYIRAGMRGKIGDVIGMRVDLHKAVKLISKAHGHKNTKKAYRREYHRKCWNVIKVMKAEAITERNNSESRHLLESIDYYPQEMRWTIFKKCIELDPYNDEAYFIRAQRKLKELADYTGALADMNKALSLNSSVDRYYEIRAMIKEKMGDEIGMCEDYRKAWECASNPKYSTKKPEFYKEMYNKKCGN